MTELLSTSTETAMHDTQDDTDIRASSPPSLLPEDVMMCESDVTHDRILTPVSLTTQGKLYQPATLTQILSQLFLTNKKHKQKLHYQH